ncbi:MAG: class I SAM-dependent methyltransferase family protein [archaeon]|nr:class I SAM-dependent methyltransferase family protein [archaeon]MCP8312957.1 class I SAM-dependent methyltransferase family protein [archaeon]
MPKMLKKALENILTIDEIKQLYGSFDIIGDIAVIKIPDALLDKKFIIAKAIMDNMKSVKTVLRQVTPVSGDFRTRELEHILGEDKTLTLYKEHGCIFKVDLAKVYFSPRLSTERIRIARKVGNGEIVVNMFAGIGSFSILIAKHKPSSMIYSIDINLDAYNLMLENVKLNKVSDRVIPLLGDARVIIEESLRGIADRVLMPLPEKAMDYLDAALMALKPKGVIHYYTHVHASKDEDPIEKAVREVKEKLKLNYSLLEARIVREVGPRWNQLVLDLLISKS